MFIYYFTLLSFLLLSSLSGKLGPIGNRLLAFIVITICIFVFGFRFEVGADWYNYLNYYNLGYKNFSIEILYLGLNGFADKYDLGFQFVIFVSTCIFFIASFYALNRLKLNPYLFLAITGPYHLVMSGMNYNRQAIALSIFLLAYSYMLTSNKYKSLLAMATAFFFHKSSLIMLPLFQAGSRKIYSVPFIAIAAAGFFATIFGDYSERYLESSRYESRGFLLRYCYIVAVVWIIFLIRKKINWDKKLKALARFDVFFALIILLLSAFSTTVADRIAYYVILSSTLLLMYVLRYRLNSKLFVSTEIFFAILFLISFSVFIVWDNFGSISQYYNFRYNLPTNWLQLW